MKIKKWDIWWVDLGNKNKGTSIQSGVRPCLVISNDKCNKYSTVLTVVPCTTRNKKSLPTHVEIEDDLFIEDSILMCEQILSVDIDSFDRIAGHLYAKDVHRVEKALKTQLGL